MGDGWKGINNIFKNEWRSSQNNTGSTCPSASIGFGVSDVRKGINNKDFLHGAIPKIIQAQRALQYTLSNMN